MLYLDRLLDGILVLSQLFFTYCSAHTNSVHNSASSGKQSKVNYKMEGLEIKLLELVAKRDWAKIIQLGKCYSLNEKSRFLWAWPSEKCLQELKKVLEKNYVRSVVSIGCGSGLLEWILGETTGLSVSGIELSNSLWTSNYSPSKFIKLHFIEADPTTKYLRECALTVDNFALIFCYFNNKSAFDKYMKVFDGNLVLIVGPKNDCGIVTDPLPLNPKFGEYNGFKWVVESIIDIDADDCNVVAVYRRE